MYYIYIYTIFWSYGVESELLEPFQTGLCAVPVPCRAAGVLLLFSLSERTFRPRSRADQSGSYFIRFTINPGRKAYDNSFDLNLNAKLIMAVFKICSGLLFCLGFVARLIQWMLFSFICLPGGNRSDIFFNSLHHVGR